MTEADGLMNAVVRYRPLPATDPQSLVDARVARPLPAGHDVLVRVEAVSVNPADVQSRGHGRPTPAGRILGYDGAGTVVDTGPDVTLLTGQSRGTLFVAGATGGVGSMVVQIAEALLPGITTIASFSTPDGDRWVRSLGAETTVNYSGDLAAQLGTSSRSTTYAARTSCRSKPKASPGTGSSCSPVPSSTPPT